MQRYRMTIFTLCFTMNVLCGLAARDGHAFPLVVHQGDTLAGIAQRVYGRVESERVLATANGLGRSGGGAVVPGTRLEVPTLGYRRTVRGDTWAELATVLLGSPERAAALAFANDSKPWLRPTDDAEILVPYNLRFVAEDGDTLPAVAQRYFGSEKRTWMLAQYNGIQNVALEPGQVLLVPITELALTEVGREAARSSLEAWSGAGGERRQQQAAAAEELPRLLASVRGGRYLETVSQGVALLAGSALSTPQRASVQRQLLEAYAALGARGRAADACREWRRAAPQAQLDPRELSPKLLSACAATQ
ncbi:MAG: LysM peptidoglycan-binding domain-containing protein [Deltaproteobacteria bacterium]